MIGKKTYINPLVLPDYPNFLAKSVDQETFPSSGWGHETKKILKERDLLKKI